MTQARSINRSGSSDPGSLGDQGRATLGSKIRPEPLASHAQALLLLRQGEDVDERPGDWSQVVPKLLKGKEIVVGTIAIESRN
jgi:hypothetical protein